MVAKRAGMTPTTFGKIEKGGHTLTSQLRDIADVLSVPIEAVLHIRLAAFSDSIKQGQSTAEEVAELKAAMHALRREVATLRAAQTNKHTETAARGHVVDAIEALADRQDRQDELVQQRHTKRSKRKSRKRAK